MTLISTSDDAFAPIAAGVTISPGYQVVAHLRRGRRLDVYDAWSETRHCRCILKLPRPDRADDVKAAAQLEREGELLMSLTHPHLVRGYAVTTTVDLPRPVVVLETLAGHTIGHMMGRRRGLRPADVAMLGSHLCSVLRYLHASGWLHLDVKPANVIASGGRAVLIDLSLVTPIGSDGGGGTFDYLSPEQARGDMLTVQADVWGVGATLYAAMTGRTPYADVSYDSDSDTGDDTGDGAVEHRYPQLERPPAPLSRRHHRQLRTLVSACLDLEPARRPSLAELAAGLEKVAGVDPRRAGEVEL
ncbi:MAG: serine/threonine protein kinase [Actinomycetota bacterium]|nr:serine/threonine protein kinase [Actinomycetota bacterium]